MGTKDHLYVRKTSSCWRAVLRSCGPLVVSPSGIRTYSDKKGPPPFWKSGPCGPLCIALHMILIFYRRRFRHKTFGTVVATRRPDLL